MLTYLLQLFPASSVTPLCQENISSINNSFNLPISKLHSYRGPKDGSFFTPPHSPQVCSQSRVQKIMGEQEEMALQCSRLTLQHGRGQKKADLLGQSSYIKGRQILIWCFSSRDTPLAQEGLFPRGHPMLQLVPVPPVLSLCPWEQGLVPASPGPFWAGGDTCREFPSASLPAAEQAPHLQPRLAHPGLHLSEASLGSLLSGDPCEPQTSPSILVSSPTCQVEGSAPFPQPAVYPESS